MSVRWPSIEHIEERTITRPGGGETSYASVVTPPIASAELRMSSKLMSLCDEATRRVVRFDERVQHLLPAFSPENTTEIAPLSSMLTRTESSASSHIEGYQATPESVGIAELRSTDDEASLIAANIRATREAFSLVGNITCDHILAMHSALMTGTDDAGRFRECYVWIGGGMFSPESAVFVPPRHERVPKAMDDLCAFMSRNDMPVLVHATLAHAQFETIHPFSDGNGRTGRALFQSILKRRGLTQQMAVPVSSGIMRDKRAYFDALTSYREGDAAPIITTFALAAITAVRNAEMLVEQMRIIHQRWSDSIKANRNAKIWSALDLVTRHPVVTRSVLSEQLGCSAAAAGTIVSTMVESGILRQVGDAERGQMFAATEVLDALRAFNETVHRSL